MSSPTDIMRRSAPVRMSRAEQANRRAGVARLLSRLALGAGFLLAGFFMVQAGLIDALWPKPHVIIAAPELPNQAVGTTTKIAGFDNQFQPFELIAAKSVQDAENKSQFHMQALVANLQRKAGNPISANANQAVYDSTTKRLDLAGNVTIAEAGRFVATMAAATMDLHTKSMTSASPVHVTTPTSTVAADAMEVNDDGTRVKFSGRVKYRLNGTTP